MAKIQFGFHASAAGDLAELPLRVKEFGGECFQFFSRDPYGGKVNPIEPVVAENFKKNRETSGVKDCYIHAPYFINLASQNNRIFYGSVKALQDDIIRAEQLGAKYVITHLGSARDYKTGAATLFSQPELSDGVDKELISFAEQKNFSPEAFNRVVKGLDNIVDGRKSVPLLLEIAAGAGAILGEKIEEMAFYFESVPAIAGICFDTCHAFASGYDLRTESEIVNIFNKIEKFIGKDKLKLIHLNDSAGDLGSNKDRHAHLGEGLIGREPFKFLIDYFAKSHYNIDMILETPTEEGLKKDLALLKGFRTKLT